MQPGTRRSCYVRYLTQNRDLGLAEPERGADEADQVGQAGHDVPVTLMEAGRTGLDQYFVVLGRRLVDVPELQHIGSALPVLGDCFMVADCRNGTTCQPAPTSWLPPERSEGGLAAGKRRKTPGGRPGATGGAPDRDQGRYFTFVRFDSTLSIRCSVPSGKIVQPGGAGVPSR